MCTSNETISKRALVRNMEEFSAMHTRTRLLRSKVALAIARNTRA